VGTELDGTEWLLSVLDGERPLALAESTPEEEAEFEHGRRVTERAFRLIARLDRITMPRVSTPHNYRRPSMSRPHTRPALARRPSVRRRQARSQRRSRFRSRSTDADPADLPGGAR